MGIVSINTQLPAQVGMVPRTVKLVTTDNLATITTAGYLNNINLEGKTISSTDVLEVIYSYVAATNSGTFELFTPSISNGVITLVQWANPGDVLLPVVSGDFAVFNGTTGQIKDAGYLPSNAAKTNVVMATGATIANHIATYTDTTGTVGEDAATAINAGNIQAGISGTAGDFVSFPPTAANGTFVFKAINNASNFASTLSNSAVGQATTYTFTDPGAATANVIISGSAGTQHITSGGLTVDAGAISSGLSTGGFSGNMVMYATTSARGLLQFTAQNNAANYVISIQNASFGQSSTLTIPDPGSTTSDFVLSQSSVATNNVSFTKVMSLGFAALASAGKINIVPHPSATSQFVVTDIKVLNSTGLSGGGGNRLLAVTDGTVIWNNAGITADLLGTPIFTIWGGTGNPVASGSTQVSTAGADIYFQYTGGTTDYTAGSVQIAVTLVQVTA